MNILMLLLGIGHLCWGVSIIKNQEVIVPSVYFPASPAARKMICLLFGGILIFVSVPMFLYAFFGS